MTKEETTARFAVVLEQLTPLMQKFQDHVNADEVWSAWGGPALDTVEDAIDELERRLSLRGVEAAAVMIVTLICRMGL